VIPRQYVVQRHHDVQDMTMANCSLAYAIAGRIEGDFSHVFFRKFGEIDGRSSWLTACSNDGFVIWNLFYKPPAGLGLVSR
jgi:hypothetical protein